MPQFVLQEFHRNISNDALLADIRRVAQQTNSDWLTCSTYAKHGEYSYNTIRLRFRSWNNAMQLAGFTIPSKAKMSALSQAERDNVYLEDVRCVATKLGKDTITSSEYAQHGHFERSNLTHKWKSWANVLKRAGLQPTSYHTAGIDEAELLREIGQLWEQKGKQPTCSDVKAGLLKYGLTTYIRRFGSWNSALRRFLEFCDEPQQPEQIEPQPTTIISTEPVYRHTTSRDVNLRLRYKVMLRDNFKCRCCGKSPATHSNIVLHIDHIVPWSEGGETTIDNLQTLCQDCNFGKSNL